MTMYETRKCSAVMANATSCLKSKMAANQPEVVISPKLWHIKTPTANLRHSTMENSQEVYQGDSNNDWQSKMVSETGNTCLWNYVR